MKVSESSFSRDVRVLVRQLEALRVYSVEEKDGDVPISPRFIYYKIHDSFTYNS